MKLSLMLVFICVFSTIGTVFAGPTTLEQENINPAFLEYQKNQGIDMSVGNGKYTGQIPDTIDFSYLGDFNKKDTVDSYPSYFDLRNQGKVTSIKNQGFCGSCWAFATYGSLESTLLPDQNLDLSEQNMKNLHGFDAGPCSGGSAQMATAYLARWDGPVLESNDPYNPLISSSPSLTPVKHVQDVIFLPLRKSALDNDEIKWALQQYGAVYVSMGWSNAFYNSYNYSYYSAVSSATGHGVTVVGWDDGYNRNKFSPAAPGNGAFIVKNSWDESWGEDGYFYVSYYDYGFAKRNVNTVFTAEEVSNYDIIYQYDPLGLTTTVGYSNSTAAWGANVFTAESNEILNAVSFYTTDLQTSYKVFIYTEPVSGPIGNLKSTVSGSFNYPGYHTVALNNDVDLTKGQKFSVVVKLTTPDYDFPMAVELPLSGISSAATSNAGESYIALDGQEWEDITSTFPNANLCIKAFTNVDRPPVLATIGNKTVNVNSLLSFTISAIDPDGDKVTYSATGLPSGAQLNATTGKFAWVPAVPGKYNVKFIATANGQTDDETIWITVTATGNTVSYIPDYDNRLRQSSPNSVLSSSNYIDIGRLGTTSYRDVMWFDLSGYDPSDTISNATLSLYWYYPPGATRTSDTVVEIYRPLEWSPQYVTWNSRMSGTSWTTPGGNWFDKNGVTQGTTPYASLTFVGSKVPDNKYYDFDVTQLVQEYVSGTNNTGFFLKAKTEGNNYIAFYSSDWANTGQGPKLTITTTSVPVDNPPVAEAGPDQVTTIGSVVMFDGSDSTDDKDIVLYSWDYGDGTHSEDTTAIATHTYTAAGNYTVTLTVTDTVGQTDSDTLQVVISSPATTITYTPDYDNRLRQSSPNSVLSSSNYIDIGRLGTTSYRDVMWFDLSGYDSSDTISKATLSLCWYYPSNTRISDTVVEIYRPLEWNPQYVTWNSRMSGMLWDTAGGNWFDKNAVAQGTTPYASVTFPAGTVSDNKYYDFDVTQLVQEYVSGTANTGFFLKAKTEGNNYIAFYSSDWSNADQRPKLTITTTSGPVDNPPVAEAGPDQVAITGAVVTFNGSASTDDKGITTYSWDFDAADGISTDASGVAATTTYATPGNYTVTLTVTDTVGQTDSDTLQVVVSSPTTTVTYTPDYDNRLRQASPNTVYSSTNYLDIGKLGTTTYRDVMWFDLSGYSPMDTISKATLSLYWYYPSTTRTSDTVVEVYRPLEWSPQYVTWNSRMSGITWTTPGGNWYDKNGVVQGTTPYASVTFPAGTVPDNKYHEFDVTQLVQEYVRGTTNTGFFLKAKTEGNNYIAFYSSDWSNADQKPKLTVTS